MPIRDFISLEQENEIIDAISVAEQKTSGEIRVHIEGSNPMNDAFERALDIFEKLEMHKTRHRNGVLFYVALNDHNFVIFGDQGINDVVPDNFWENTKDLMVTYFRKGLFSQGIIEGILKAGEKLQEYFPSQDDDWNELPNEISKGHI